LLPEPMEMRDEHDDTSVDEARVWGAIAGALP
jgi:hypothetical protein